MVFFPSGVQANQLFQMVFPTMANESQPLLSQCMGLVYEWLEQNPKAYLNIKIDDHFKFEFSH